MVRRFTSNALSFHGQGAIQEIPGLVQKKGFKKAFVTTDPDLLKFGVTKKVTDLLDENGLDYEVYSDIKPNPAIENVLHGVAAFKASGADYMITVGGGSSIDTGKAIGIIINNPEYEDVRSLEGRLFTKNRTVYTITVPTTAGTGSEITASYIISDEERKRKFICSDPNAVPDVAIVDPDMMSSMPKGLTAATGMDALTHAIEGFMSVAAWTLPSCVNLEAMRMVSKHLRSAVAGEMDGREGMAVAEYMAGMGFACVGLGLAHSIAHTLGAWYGVPHGLACAVSLPVVMEYNADASGEKYKDIAAAMGVDVIGMDQDAYRKAAVDAVRNLMSDIGIAPTLEAIRAEDLDGLAETAFKDGCTMSNPKASTPADLRALIEKLMA